MQKTCGEMGFADDLQQVSTEPGTIAITIAESIPQTPSYVLETLLHNTEVSHRSDSDYQKKEKEEKR